jgi:general L-amino acid transport system permease protein
MAGLLVVSYFAGKWLRERVSERNGRLVLVFLWILSFPTILLVILRDPAWDWERMVTVNLPLTLGFIIVGGAIIGFLSNPDLRERGRLISGALLIIALGSWAFPMLIKVRLLLLLLAVFALAAPSFTGDKAARRRYLIIWGGTVAIVMYFLTAVDTASTLDIQAKSFLGGLLLTFVLAIAGIFISFPIGVLMALGRTSSMPIFRLLSTIYIEVVRGIPFITVLIFADIILELFLPEGLQLDDVVQAIAATALFSAAYLAENVRGGLQSVQKGQYEASNALGMTTLQTTTLIVLPQALRAVIPALVGQTIAIFKDTSLVAIIGLFDFLFIASKVVSTQTAFLGARRENLLFVAFGYWIFTFTFSRASQRLERKLGLGER